MGPKLGIYRGSHLASHCMNKTCVFLAKKECMRCSLQIIHCRLLSKKSHFYAVYEGTTDRIHALLKKNM